MIEAEAVAVSGVPKQVKWLFYDVTFSSMPDDSWPERDRAGNNGVGHEFDK